MDNDDDDDGTNDNATDNDVAMANGKYRDGTRTPLHSNNHNKTLTQWFKESASIAKVQVQHVVTTMCLFALTRYFMMMSHLNLHHGDNTLIGLVTRMYCMM